MWVWITRHADPLGATAAVIGLVVSIFGFGLTFYQLRQATNQLQASNEYAIRKDLRELVQAIAPKIRPCLEDAANCASDEIQQSLGLLFNFHQSVYRQAKASGISDTFRAQMADDFCQWFEVPEVEAFWKAQVQANLYKGERLEMKEQWCSQKKP